MLVEVEGINHTGKTTLVTTLKARGVNVHKFQRTVDNPLRQMCNAHIDMAESSKTWVIDRGHGTEWTMTRALRRPVPYSQLAFWKLDEYLAQLDTLIVYLSAPKDVIEARMTATGRQWEAEYETLDEAWELFLATTLCRVIRLDGDLAPHDLVVKFEQQVLSLFKEDRVNGCT